MNNPPGLSWFNTLTVKVFIGFWIIAISVMTITRFVSEQFIDEKRIEVVNKKQLIRADHLINKVRRTLQRSQQPMMHKRVLTSPKMPPGLWFKSVKTGEIFTNVEHHPDELRDYIQSFQFTQPVNVTFHDYQFSGPFDLSVGRAGQKHHYQLFISKPTSRRDFVKAFGRLPLWLRASTAFIVTGLLSWLLSWYLIGPIKKLTTASNRFGGGDLSVRLPEFDSRGDEVGQLGQAFNNMADHLQNSIAAQQRLLGDVSHELRSPLTRLQLALSLAKSVKGTPQEMDKYLQRFDLEIQRLDDMISDALKLSRLENQLQSMQSAQFDLSILINNLLKDCEILCQNKQLSMNSDIEEHIQFFGDAQLLSSAIENILNNAIRYSPEDTSIEVTLKKTEQTLQISIADHGPGVGEQHISKIFTPFYRTEEARDRVSGGTGLGLAIASNAVACHDGAISARLTQVNEDMPGLTVLIELPVKAL